MLEHRLTGKLTAKKHTIPKSIFSAPRAAVVYTNSYIMQASSLHVYPYPWIILLHTLTQRDPTLMILLNLLS